MLTEAVTCMAIGEDPSNILVGMNDAQIAMIRAGRNFLEVLGQFKLGPAVKTFHSINKAKRGDYALGTTSGICFVTWDKFAKKFDTIKQTPTSSSGPPLALLNNRQTLCQVELKEDFFVTCDYN